MAVAPESIAAIIPLGSTGVRVGKRDETIRIVEYSRFPRAAPLQELRIGFTRDVSAAGMCLGVDECEPVGSLLRLSVRDVAGWCAGTFIGRVVWTDAERDGRFWLGLELLTEAPKSNPGIRPAEDGNGGTAVGQSRV